MKLQKLPSGSYRIQKTINGKRRSFTFDHKPTQKEIEEEVYKSMGEVRLNGRTTFKAACEVYINNRVNTISPSTVREYTGYVDRIEDWFMSMLIDDITENDVQIIVNNLAIKKSPKTVRNYYGFISSVLGLYRPDLHLRIKLPQKTKETFYVPKSDDIKALIEYSKGKQMEVPMLLGCYGMRRSEICALTPADIEGNVIHINKAMVKDKDNNWVIKTTKTTSSTRDIIVPDEVIETINRVGLYKGTPNYFDTWLKRAEKSLGIESFSFHKLRHYFASQAHASGIPDVDVMRFGGWETDRVMKGVYRHSLEKDSTNVSNAITNSILK